MATSSEKKQAFQHWLSRKAGNDYWFQPNVPADFASLNRQDLLRQLAERQLPCEHLIWHVTNRCNLKCLHCGVWGGERRYQDLSSADFFARLPELLSLGLRAVTLSGGEPFLRRDLFEIVAGLKAAALKVAIVTNGHYMQRYAAQIRAAGFDSISISLDGLRDSHNRMRVSSDSYEQVIEAIRLARAYGIPIVNVNTSVSPDNLAELAELRELIFAAGANHWVLRPVAPAGRAAGRDMTLDHQQLRHLLDFAKDSVIAGNDVSLEGLGYLGKWDSILALVPFFSYTGWNNLYLLPDGSLKGFNDDHNEVEGHWQSDSLTEVWFERFKSYRFPEIPVDCLSCPYWSRCGGGNIAEAENGWRCIRPVLEQADREG